MEIINDEELQDIIKSTKNKKSILVEPSYVRKWIPLGLAKISSAIKANKGEVVFTRSYGMNFVFQEHSFIFLTSLFTYYSKEVLDEIKKIRGLNKNIPIIIGGIYASLMPKHLKENIKNSKNMFLFKGYSPYLDSFLPDYSIDYKINPKFQDYACLFTTRGCPNNCAYCLVKKIEPEQIIVPNWKENILNNDKGHLIIYDNNLTSFPKEHLKNVVEVLEKSGKRCLFDGGFDIKHIDKKSAKLLSRIKFVTGGLRIAFDRIEEDKTFQRAVKLLLESGISKSTIMAYVIFNFNDTPKEANYRLEECKKLGIRPYPNPYVPLNKTNKITKNKFIGKHWTKNLMDKFRYFWLMRSTYANMTFDEYIQKNKKKFTKEDLEKWNFK